jgi:hypothetical protein
VFFETKILYWLEAISLIKTVPYVSAVLSSTMAWSKVSAQVVMSSDMSLMNFRMSTLQHL